jgi:hypothetical protein
MLLRKSLIVLSMAGIAGGIVFGCSSSSNNTTPPDEGGVGGPDAKKEANTSSSGGEGGDDAAPAGCVALSTLGGFTPSYKPPAPHKDACSQGNIDNYRKFCLGDQADMGAACNAFEATAAGKTCEACIVTPPSAAALGPLIEYNGYVLLNISGCLQLAQKGDDTCAKATSNLTQCENAACASCSVKSQADLDALDQCNQAADNGACQQYTAPADCLGQAAEAGTAGQCLAGVGATDPFTTGYTAIVPIFCLAGDGGITDAGDGGG